VSGDVNRSLSFAETKPLFKPRERRR